LRHQIALLFAFLTIIFYSWFDMINNNNGNYQLTSKTNCTPIERVIFIHGEDGSLIGPKSRKQVEIKVEQAKYKLETPSDPNGKVETLADVKKPVDRCSEKMKVVMTKRQVHKKFKHRHDVPLQSEAEVIDTYTDFRDNQVGFVQTKSPTKVIVDSYLLGENSQPTPATFVLDQADCAVVVIQQLSFSTGPGTFMKELQYNGPRVLSPNKFQRLLRHGLIGNDGKYISIIRHCMSLEEVLATPPD
jgi:hypothetical protein